MLTDIEVAPPSHPVTISAAWAFLRGGHFEDLADRSVAIGEEGSGIYLTARLLFESSDVKPRDMVPVGPVEALAVSGELVYAAGMFGMIGGKERGGIAQIDATGKATAWMTTMNWRGG